MRQLLPDWFYGFVPPGWMDRPQESFRFSQNVIPIAASGGIVTPIVKELVFSKKQDVVVFAAAGLVTDTTGANISDPLGGVNSQILVKLANPAGNDIFTSDFVPFENIFAAWSGMPAFGGGAITAGASLPSLWPCPIAIRAGGSLQFQLQNLNTIAAKWIRLTFDCAMLFKRSKRAA